MAAVASGRVPARDVGRVEDWRLLSLLLALVLSVAMVRASRLFDRGIDALIAGFSTARSLTFALVAASGVLSAFVTNDVALFVVIPLTLAAARYSDFRVRNAVILEVIAANLVGCVSPVGNPQNLFIAHRFGISPARFVALMSPFCASMLALITAAILAMEPRRRVARVALPLPTVDRQRAAAGLLGIALVVAESGRFLPAGSAAVFAAVLAVAALGFRLAGAGISVVPLFFFVFIDMAALRSLAVSRLYSAIPIAPMPRLYLSSLLGSQILSNVPTAVLLAPLAAGDARTLLFGVSAGGCGTLVASLANLLGWQIYAGEAGRDAVFLRRFLAVNLVFLAAAGAVGALLIA